MTLHIEKFYKLIVIKLNLFESAIADEKHFATYQEALNYSNAYNKNDYRILIFKM